MGERLDLQFQAQSMEQLMQRQITLEDFLQEVFNANQGGNYLQMCTALKAYHHQNGGAPEVLAFEVTQPLFHAETLAGSFSCKFKVSFFFGCDDLYIDKTDTITWQFKISPQSYTMHLTGEEPWSSD